jgi:hypothetical protein
MKVPAKYKKWLTKKALFNCFYVGGSLIVIAWLLEFANVILSNDLPYWLKGLYLVGMTFFFGFVIWLLALINPELMETIFSMLGYKEKDNEDKT